jgi:arylsulfatase A-like enzyme
MDFYPTILELAGLPPQPTQHVDGTSIVPLLTGEVRFARDLYWYYPYYHGSLWRPGAAIRSGDLKLVEFFESNWFEMYDLSNDISENSNLALEHPEKARELRQKMYGMIKESGAGLPVLNSSFVPDTTNFRYP